MVIDLLKKISTQKSEKRLMPIIIVGSMQKHAVVRAIDKNCKCPSITCTDKGLPRIIFLKT